MKCGAFSARQKARLRRPFGACSPCLTSRKVSGASMNSFVPLSPRSSWRAAITPFGLSPTAPLGALQLKLRAADALRASCHGAGASGTPMLWLGPSPCLWCLSFILLPSSALGTTAPYTVHDLRERVAKQGLAGNWRAAPAPVVLAPPPLWKRQRSCTNWIEACGRGQLRLMNDIENGPGPDDLHRLRRLPSLRNVHSLHPRHPRSLL